MPSPPCRARNTACIIKLLAHGRVTVSKVAKTFNGAIPAGRSSARQGVSCRRPAQNQVKYPGWFIMNIEVGKIVHYDDQSREAILMLKDLLIVGERIQIRGDITACLQIVESLRINRQTVFCAQPGDRVTIRVNTRVRENDCVYRVVGRTSTPNVTL